MEPLTIVVGFDVGEQIAAVGVATEVVGVMDEFGLQGSQKSTEWCSNCTVHDAGRRGDGGLVS